MIIQAIHDISALCAAKGIQYVVLSPGSRCAPLTISFARNNDIQKFAFSDERSAAFHALGIAASTNTPVVLVCTSGSAAYNYAPAVAEAYYQQIPLIILTADRPPEWIDQLDGQTIRQNEIYGRHVKQSYTLPDTYESPEAYWHSNRIVNEAINLSEAFPKGPVHINVPIREPFYPAPEETLLFSSDIRVIKAQANSGTVPLEQYVERLKSFDKVLLVPGQQQLNDRMTDAVSNFCEQTNCTLVADVISNLQEVDSAVIHQDLFINSQDPLPTGYHPNLLITFGKSLISKNLKLFLRKHPAVEHWHIQQSTHRVADTFQNLTEIIVSDPAHFFESISTAYRDGSEFEKQKKQNFRQAWTLLDKRTNQLISEEVESETFNELTAIGSCISSLPDHSNLHLANSMAVRYVNFVALKDKKGINVFCNRGTSGIDGSNSTAYGQALVTEQLVTLITGDLAFFYDRNAFWNRYHPANLRIILINNHGGGIFRMIPGPVALEELEDYFVTTQDSQASHVAAEFDLQHTTVNNKVELDRALQFFFHKSKTPKILEIKTNSVKSSEYLKLLKRKIQQGLMD